MNEISNEKEKDKILFFNGTAVNHTEKCTKKRNTEKVKERQVKTIKKEINHVPKIYL